MFQYRVFRQRFLRTAAAVIMAALLLFGVAYAFFSREWVNAAQNEANALFRASESAMQTNERLVDQQLARVYEDSELTMDLRVFSRSQSVAAYLEGRRESSQSTFRLIRSFPEDVRIYLLWHAKSLVQAEVRDENHANWIIMQSDAPRLQFDMRSVDGKPSYETQNLLYVHRTVYDPNGAYVRIGEVSFGFDMARIVSTPVSPNYRMAVVLDAQGHARFLAGGSEADQALLGRLLEGESGVGSLMAGGINRAYYSIFESGPYGYRLIVCTDDMTIISRNTGMIISIALILAILAFTFLSMAYSGLRYDAAFLGRILSVIEAVREGDYSPPPKLRARFRNNEYGLIARELDRMSHELHRQIVLGYQLALRQRDAEMKALQSTINPHFLYNTLEVIRSRMLVDGDRETADAVANLGAMYRDIVKRTDVITLGEEIQILEKYLRLMAFRYPDTFVYQIDVPEALRSLKTVKLWMQPLAENFLKHGFRGDGALNLLILTGQRIPNGVRIEIRDNGTGMAQTRLEEVCASIHSQDADADGVGVRNVHMRLTRFYGEGYSMRIENNPEGGVRVSVDLPWEVEECTRS